VTPESAKALKELGPLIHRAEDYLTALFVYATSKGVDAAEYDFLSERRDRLLAAIVKFAEEHD